MEVLDTVASVHGLEQSLHNHLYQEYSDYEYPEPLKVGLATPVRFSMDTDGP